MKTFSAGDLDTGYDTDGKKITDLGGTDVAMGVAVQSDGKIVIAGYTTNGTGGTDDGFVIRTNTDGSLDTTFGGDGIVTTDIASGSSKNNRSHAVALQSDGKIVAVGRVYLTGVTDFSVIRYNTDGSLDTTFGGDGIVTTDVMSYLPTPQTDSADIANAVAIRSSDGIIFAAGSCGHSHAQSGYWSDFCVAAYNSDGSLYTGFNSVGVQYTSFGNSSFAQGIAIQSDGRVVIAGYAYPPSVGNYNFGAARYNADGSADSAFDGDGSTHFDICGQTSDTLKAVGLQSDGKIVVAGYATDINNSQKNYYTLASLNTNGSLNTAFGSGGIATDCPSGTGYNPVVAMVIQADNKIVAGGTSSVSNYDFTVRRFNTDGTADSTFGTAGKVTTNVLSTGTDYIYGLAARADGKLAAVGIAGSDIASARYIVSGSDLQVAISANPSSLNSGEAVVYTATVTNNGPDSAPAVTVTDALPSSLSFVSATSSQGSCSGSSTVSCSLGSLAGGSSATVTVTTTADVGGIINNTVSVAGDVNDSDSSNNSATATVSVQTSISADLGVTRSAVTPNPPYTDEAFSYTLTVANAGPDSVSGVEMAETLSGSVSVADAQPSQGTCSVGDTGVSCSLGSLSSGSSVTVTLTLIADTAGTIHATANVGGQASDADLTDNTAEADIVVDDAPSGPDDTDVEDGQSSAANTTIGAQADIAVSKTISPENPSVTDPVTLTILVTNNGPDTAYGIVVNHTLEGSFDEISIVTTQGSCEGTLTIVCELGDLADGETATITITAVPTETGTVNRNVLATGEVDDPDESNNVIMDNLNIAGLLGDDGSGATAEDGDNAASLGGCGCRLEEGKPEINLFLLTVCFLFFAMSIFFRCLTIFNR